MRSRAREYVRRREMCDLKENYYVVPFECEKVMARKGGNESFEDPWSWRVSLDLWKVNAKRLKKHLDESFNFIIHSFAAFGVLKGTKIDAIIMVLVAVDFLNCFILMPSKSHSFLMLAEDFNAKREKVDEKYQVLWHNWLFRECCGTKSS